MDRGHETLLNSNAFLNEHMTEWRQAIGRAGCIGNDIHACLVVLSVVHAHHKSLECTLAWSGDDYLLGTSLDVTLGFFIFYEEASRLNDVLNAQRSPSQSFGSFPAGHDALDLVAIDNQLVCSANLHIVLESAMHGVVLHLVGEVLRISGHIDD